MRTELLITTGTVLLLFTPFVVLCGRSLNEEQRARERLRLLGVRRLGKNPAIHVEALWKESSRTDEPRLTQCLRIFATRVGIDSLVSRSASTISSLTLVIVCVTVHLATVACTAFVWRMWWVALLAGCLAGYLPIHVLRGKAARRVRVMDAALPHVADLLSRALRAGQSLPMAFGILAEQGPHSVRAEFGEVFRQQKFGRPLHDAFLELLQRVPSHELKLLATGILMQRDTGGNLTQMLDKMSAVIRDRIKIEGDIRVQTAQGKLTGWILCLLPITLLLLMKVLNPLYLQAFSNDPMGRICLWTSFVLLGCGALIIRHLIKRIEI